MKPTVFILKVDLQWETEVWRKIAIRADQTLEDLHFAIFDAFDRYEEHLYSFFFPKPGSRGRARRRDAIEYTCPECVEADGVYDDDELDRAPRDATEATMESLNLRAHQKFQYLFDWGDEWMHDISVEQTKAPAEKGKYPRVVEKHGKSPPQYPNYDDEEYDEDDEDGDEDDAV
jgi:hypothetical protein